ncbi:hypothetical protein PUNSTDRAFT_138050 [Punctularia strigosozonata HHB-11173 SS5]|uniref:BTB domain-containing protein n=1 Tax=Punctularia strigosozonata (strain HHB-11173) TaxID=741275 RepID=R7S5Q0_PUNST|nr:uncharacterized protein PUNSTDRAFT_138050 [Punctularia strigosozonata HHB-11173 SS5]EIN04851.1 hypothetical protein PUNSTDRAFT_138050 [Punctularia strigosozonata HHB-11173 SS5]
MANIPHVRFADTCATTPTWAGTVGGVGAPAAGPVQWTFDEIFDFDAISDVDNPPLGGSANKHNPASFTSTKWLAQAPLTGSDCTAPTPTAFTSVSAIFGPGLFVAQTAPDLILVSADHVHFYVHQHLLAKSTNGFNGLLARPSGLEAYNNPAELPSALVPESVEVLNVALHGVYNLTWTTPIPSFEVASGAVTSLVKYGFDVKPVFAPSTTLFGLFSRSYAPSVPMDVYCFAASYDLVLLAVFASKYLLSFPLCALDDTLAEKMGPRYLRRLFFLHLGRTDALKRLLLPQPAHHAPNAICGTAEGQRLTRAWALASAYIAWDARPDLTSQEIRSVMDPLLNELECTQCQLSFLERSSALIARWGEVKTTILAE